MCLVTTPGQGRLMSCAGTSADLQEKHDECRPASTLTQGFNCKWGAVQQQNGWRACCLNLMVVSWHSPAQLQLHVKQCSHIL